MGNLFRREPKPKKQNNENQEISVIIFGDLSVGKTTLMEFFLQQQNQRGRTYGPTGAGRTDHFREIDVDGKKVKITVSDVAGNATTQ